jgi:hypothetical protein
VRMGPYFLGAANIGLSSSNTVSRVNSCASGPIVGHCFPFCQAVRACLCRPVHPSDVSIDQRENQ